MHHFRIHNTVITQELILREKLNDYYSEVFEEELIDEIVKVGRFDKVKSGELLIDIGSEMTHIPLILDGVVKSLFSTKLRNPRKLK